MILSVALVCGLFSTELEDSSAYPRSMLILPASDESPETLYGGTASILSRGGPIYFGLELRPNPTDGPERVDAWITTGPRRTRVPAELHLMSGDGSLGQQDGRLVLHFEPYDALIFASQTSEGPMISFTGAWRKRRSREDCVELPFVATFTRAVEQSTDRWTKSDAELVVGRWAARFGTEGNPAVGVFNAQPDGTLIGTFLTPTGDFGFLSGWCRGDRVYFSAFDGGHALLLKATLQPDGTLAGDFWAGDRHHETWTARRDPAAALPDAFTLAKVNERADPASLVFPDVHGDHRSLADEKFAGKARIIQIFGTWCPNCHDEAVYLAELDARYRDRGLSIVGLAFELTGDAARDAQQVKRYAERHNIRYPLLIAGTRDQAKAANVFPMLERIPAYPTTLFLHADGRVRAVHTGYTGPAAGEDHHRLRGKFEAIIEELLGE